MFDRRDLDCFEPFVRSVDGPCHARPWRFEAEGSRDVPVSLDLLALFVHEDGVHAWDGSHRHPGDDGGAGRRRSRGDANPACDADHGNFIYGTTSFELF